MGLMNDPFYNRILAIAALLGVAAVSIGAFGAHYLRSRLELHDLEILRTGVLYMFIHILATGLVAVIATGHVHSRLLKSAAVFFIVGILLFSGSLFILSTDSLTGIPSRFIGPVTPFGGLCFIAGWLMLFLYFISPSNRQNT